MALIVIVLDKSSIIIRVVYTLVNVFTDILTNATVVIFIAIVVILILSIAIFATVILSVTTLIVITQHISS